MAPDPTDAESLVRAVLVSLKGYVEVSVFDAHYQQIVGEPIPWRALGHTSLEAYLSLSPELARIEQRDGKVSQNLKI